MEQQEQTKYILWFMKIIFGKCQSKFWNANHSKSFFRFFFYQRIHTAECVCSASAYTETAAVAAAQRNYKENAQAK